MTHDGTQHAPLHRDDLVAGLHARGVCYLAPTPHGDERPLTDDELVGGLAQSDNARLRFSLAALFLLHPEVAARAADLLPSLPPPAGLELRKQYLAAMYLQRLWRTRLQAQFGPTAAIPERFTAAAESPVGVQLPAPDEMHGKLGLRTLCESSPYNDWSSYEQVVELLCNQPCGGPVV